MTAFTARPNPGSPEPRDTRTPANRAERRGHGKQKGPAPLGRGKVRGDTFGGSAQRRYQARKSG
jgi:hypothetical protein